MYSEIVVLAFTGVKLGRGIYKMNFKSKSELLRELIYFQKGLIFV